MRQRNRPTQVLVGFLSFTCIFGVLAPAALGEPVDAMRAGVYAGGETAFRNFQEADLYAAGMTENEELGPPPRITDTLLLPAARAPHDTGTSLKVDTHNRSEVVSFFNSVYRASVGVPMGWTGSLEGCLPGTTSAPYEEATILRVNYYRAMGGLPADVILDSGWNAKCQAAALMMSAQGQLSHYPDASWACYSEDGKDAAGHSNLAGCAGPEAIEAYMHDWGDSNYFVGHRRWILYPPQKVMGTGSVPATSVNGTYHFAANALWVVGGFGTRPAAPEWVAWPPDGYVPYPVVYPRWSFSYPGADFSRASVAMSQSGSPVPLVTLALLLFV